MKSSWAEPIDFVEKVLPRWARPKEIFGCRKGGLLQVTSLSNWTYPNPIFHEKLKGNLKNAKTEEEKKKFISERIELLKEMEIKMVVVGYDGEISFPENRKKKSEKKISEKVE